MIKFDELKQEFITLRRKVNHGDIFQSLGDLMKESLNKIPPQPLTVVSLPVDGEFALNRIQSYTHEINQLSENEDFDVDSHDFRVKDTDLEIIVEQLANPIAKYRDTGAFFFLSDVIQNDLLTHEQLIWLTDYLISDEQLFAHILEPQNDAIYRRSFSVMVLSLLLFSNRIKASFMSEKQMDRVINQVALYAALERDGRGFINDNGWAHAFTHIGNTVSEIFLMPDLVRADKMFVLGAVLSGYRELSQPLTFGETSRLVEVIIYVANQHDLYADYLLFNLKMWRKDLVTHTPPHTQRQWQQLYNRSQFFHEILLRGKNDVPEAVFDYVNMTKNYLA
ncbi:hypothetical protein GCM10025879_09340 [Leuconostoc litchii]|uniref:DUF2785 domain-containing protein n=1 Tax=Leuconostoc litchii TaxID=1981069 RepID=A0A6P2CNY4_9LACO|nr:DUF2785 domain-containing protein [Leuconostoc litchii]TYC47640.1 DUF2785 domain-containing protein [Leuconostoc litchii]GMA69688.1 hypothetical protein GCM10025879_09340 [Leuconostoc litchii]